MSDYYSSLGSVLVQSFHYCSHHMPGWLLTIIIIVKLPLLLMVEIEIWHSCQFSLLVMEREIYCFISHVSINIIFACKSNFSNQDQSPHPNYCITFLQVNTCNGFYCDYFSPNKAYKPKMWTEAWTGWYNKFEACIFVPCYFLEVLISCVTLLNL